MKNLIIILSTISLGFATPSFKMKDNVEKFMTESSKNYTRSGKVKTAGNSPMIAWPSSEIYTKSANIAGNSQYLVGLIHSICPKKLYDYYTDVETSTIRTELVIKTPSNTVEDTVKLLSILNDKIISKIPNKLNLELHDIAYIQKDDSINGAIIRLRRLFKDGLLVNNVSYLSIETDVTGKILGLEAVWPEFIPEKSSYEMIDLDLAKSTLISVLNSNYSSAVGIYPVNAVEFVVTGVTNAWDYVELDGKEVLSPAYSFTVQSIFDSGDKQSLIITIPLIKSLYN